MANDSLPEAMDVVFVDSLRVAANIGRDCWGRAREQPVELTVYLHLKESYLGAAGESDNVVDSVHYGHLTKAISDLIKSRTESDTPGFDNADDLIRAVTERAFELAGEAVVEVRVVLDVPKMILLATGLSVDVTTAKGTPGVMSKKVLVKDIVIPVIIGVNPPEREVKQRVVVNIIFHENTSSVSGPAPNYQETVSRLSKVGEMALILLEFIADVPSDLFQDIEASSYFTLEKFVMQIVRSSCLASERISAVTVRAQKPSALSFAQSSGVEITRKRETFLQQ